MLNRRSFLTASAAALPLSGLIRLNAGELRRQHKAMILLWMAGGPSQFETFDPKPGASTGGPTRDIATAVPGLRIAEGWDATAAAMDEIAVIRSMTNKEGNHPRATYQLHTGYLPSGGLTHPHFGSVVAERTAADGTELPSVVSVGRTESAGHLGVGYEPFLVTDPGRRPENTALATGRDRFDRRRTLLGRLESGFASRGGAASVAAAAGFRDQAADLVLSPQLRAFDLADEPASLQARYGDTQFGRGCLLARRLVEAGVSFVEVRSNGWDTHFDNFEATRKLSAGVDPAFATLIADLKDRGLLDSTLIVWMGEFGRTPRLNARVGRDHFPRAFSIALAGGGVQGGRVIGATTADGTAVSDRPVTVPDLFCTACYTLGIDPHHEYDTPGGRPVKLVDGGAAIEELFA